MALTTINVRRAFILIFRDVAEILSIESDNYITHNFLSWKNLSQTQWKLNNDNHYWINCVNFHLMTPKIIRLTQFNQLPYRKVRLTKRNLYARDRHVCQYCGENFPQHELSLDHIIPKSQGGKSTWKNMVCACVPCNAHKDNKTPEQANMKLIKNPNVPKISPVMTKHIDTNPEWEPFIN